MRMLMCELVLLVRMLLMQVMGLRMQHGRRMMRLSIAVLHTWLSETGRSRHGSGHASVLVLVIDTVETIVGIVRRLGTARLSGGAERAAPLPGCVSKVVAISSCIP